MGLRALAYDPFAAGNDGDEFGGRVTADVGQDCYCRDGDIDWYEWLCLIAVYEECCNRGKEEHVHEVHAKGQSRYLCHNLRRVCLFYATEHKEGSEC